MIPYGIAPGPEMLGINAQQVFAVIHFDPFEMWVTGVIKLPPLTFDVVGVLNFPVG